MVNLWTGSLCEEILSSWNELIESFPSFAINQKPGPGLTFVLNMMPLMGCNGAYHNQYNSFVTAFAFEVSLFLSYFSFQVCLNVPLGYPSRKHASVETAKYLPGYRSELLTLRPCVFLRNKWTAEKPRTHLRFWSHSGEITPMHKTDIRIPVRFGFMYKSCFSIVNSMHRRWINQGFAFMQIKLKL